MPNNFRLIPFPEIKVDDAYYDALKAACQSAYEHIYVFHLCPPDCEDPGRSRDYFVLHRTEKQLRVDRECAVGEAEYGVACQLSEYRNCSASLPSKMEQIAYEGACADTRVMRTRLVTDQLNLIREHCSAPPSPPTAPPSPPSLPPTVPPPAQTLVWLWVLLALLACALLCFGARRLTRGRMAFKRIWFRPPHPFLPYVAPHLSHISPFILVF